MITCTTTVSSRQRITSGRAAGILTTIGTLLASKACCIIPVVLTFFGASAGTLGITLSKVLIPFVAWPALLWTHYKFWTKTRACFNTARGRIIDYGIVGLSTILFCWVLIRVYIPENITQHVTPPMIETTSTKPEKCPFCK